MALYDAALYDDSLIPQQTLQQAYQPAELNNGSESLYGFGWDLGTYKGETILAHGGAWLAFDSYYLRFPQDHLMIFVVFSQTDGQTDAEGSAFAIADIVLN